MLIDGNDELFDRGRRFYAANQETYRIGPTIACEWITAANVNEILARHGYDQEIDLLTIDMDGVDYWILKAIELRSRVIVVEYNNRIPAGEVVTVPYGDEFTAEGGATVKPLPAPTSTKS